MAKVVEESVLTTELIQVRKDTLDKYLRKWLRTGKLDQLTLVLLTLVDENTLRLVITSDNGATQEEVDEE